MPNITVSAKDFRVFEAFEWRPEGVCLLTGANGAGKTTALNMLLFLRELFTRGVDAAFLAVDGVAFRRAGIPPEDPVIFTVQVDEIRWRLRFPMSATGLRGHFGEELLRGDEVILRAGLFQDIWYIGKQEMPFDDLRCCARVFWDRGEAPWMKPLVDALYGMALYPSYQLDAVKRVEPVRANETTLHATGRNLWSVLSTWKDSSIKHGGRFEWVMTEARRAFPGIMGTYQPDRELPILYPPGATDPAEGLYPNRMADGLLTGLLHLTAVAAMRDGALVAFDEVENQLHPHAIRSILAAIRQRADEHDLTVVMTTHSPVVLNEFKGWEDRVYVLQKEADKTQPVRLDELHDPNWLSHFALGDLYEREHFAAPVRRSED